jgi:peroxiredoxin
MSLTPSTMLPLGTQAPYFELPDTNGKTVSLNDFKGSKALLVMFICNHCPYVKHIKEHLARLVTEYQQKGVGAVAINSNDVATYPDDRPEVMAREVKQFCYTFPYLYDESQEIATAYHAACTPDLFVFDADHRLVYRGQFDGSRPGNDLPVTGRDLREALDAVLAGGKPSEDQKPSMGCNIKWKPGREPAYTK